MAVMDKQRKPRRKAPKAAPPAAKVWTPAAVRATRERLGLTIEQAAAKVGVTPRTFYSWELASQDREPSASHKILLGLLDSGTL
jgi:DNA-binding transcriptional regulator YiaG